MKKLFATLAVVFSFVFFITAPFVTHAQTPPATTPEPSCNPSTPNAAGGMNKDLALKLYNACSGTATPVIGTTCQITADLNGNKLTVTPAPTPNIVAKCTSVNLSLTFKDSCDFTYSDGSKFLIDPNAIVGSQEKNLDAAGCTVKSQNTGLFGESTGGGTGDVSNTGVPTALDAATAPLWWMIQLLGHIILTFSGWLLGIAGILFNWTVYLTVFQFGHLVGNSAGMLAAWTVLRDIGNIALLFGFVFMGIGTILNLHDYNAKKALPALIIFAVLLNFSLFAAEAVIDTSNIFASQMYNQAGICAEGSTSEECQKDKNYGIAGKIMDNAGVSSVFSIPTIAQLATGDRTKEMVVLLGLSLFLTITAIVLIAGSIMLIIRAVTLTFIIVTSPIGFAGMAIPPLHGLASEWWKKLLSQAFFAPIYLLMILISLKLMEGIRIALGSGTGENTDLAHLFSDTGASSVTAAVTFVMLIGLMIGAMMAAKSMGAIGAGFATNTASALVFGGVARGTNFAVGGAANLLGKTRLANNKYVSGAIRGLKNTNLDMRRLPGVAGALGAGGITAGAKPAEHASYNDIAHQYQDIKEGKWGKDLERAHQKEMADKNLEKDAHDSRDGTLSDASQQHLASLSEKELVELHGIKAGVAALAQNLSSEQFTALMKSDKLDAGQKENLKNARFKKLSEEMAKTKTGTPAEQDAAKAKVKALLKGMSAAELDQIAKSSSHSSYLRDQSFVDGLSNDQMEALGKSSNVTSAQKSTLNTTRAARFNDPTSAANALASMTSTQIGALDGGILTRPHVYEKLGAEEFEQIRKKGGLTAAQRVILGNHIANAATTPNHPDSAQLIAYINSDPRVKAYWNIP